MDTTFCEVPITAIYRNRSAVPTENVI